jgi:hypothetical protein
MSMVVVTQLGECDNEIGSVNSEQLSTACTTIKVTYNSAHRSASSLWHNLVPGCKLAGVFAS